MPKSELSQRNYKRITLINWLLSVPLIILFAWPYIYLARFLTFRADITYLGSFLFAFPFTLTILHGHVTMALGSAHRHFYYEWLEKHNLTYGLFFHPIFTRTRFRLVPLVVSLLILMGGGLFLV